MDAWRYEPVAGPAVQIYGGSLVKPRIYGYLRADDEIEDQQIRRMERAFTELADSAGLCFATTFYEYVPGCHGAFDELVAELGRAQAQHVVVPSLCHLSRHQIIRRLLVTRLSLEANAQVWIIEPCAATNPVDLPPGLQTTGVTGCFHRG